MLGSLPEPLILWGIATTRKYGEKAIRDGKFQDAHQMRLPLQRPHQKFVKVPKEAEVFARLKE